MSHFSASPIPDIYINRIYNEADPDCDVHCETFGRLADVLGVDMAAAVADKLDKNARKYPEPQS